MDDVLVERFEGQRGRLRAVAYRMVGSLAEADDAVQETWLRLSRSDVSGVDNLAGWLTTVVSRVCLDMLRARREQPVGVQPPDSVDGRAVDPEQEAQLADSVGRALLVVLASLAPAERVAFVLHDAFGVPFAEIGDILARTPGAAKKLAGRARGKVRAGAEIPRAELVRQRGVIDSFLAAIRSGDLDRILAVLAPDVVRRADPAALPDGAPTEIRGARRVAEEARFLSPQRSRNAEPALINGSPGVVVTLHGRLALALTCMIEGDRIAGFEVVADPERLRGLRVAVLDVATSGGR